MVPWGPNVDLGSNSGLMESFYVDYIFELRALKDLF